MAAARRDEHERIVREGKWLEAIRAYLAATSFADAMVGRVLDALERSEYGRNTIVVFWSDNGWHLGEKEHWHKSTLWQRSTHVPMIVAAPGNRSNGVGRTQTVTLLDLYPTMVELCGLPRKADLEGTSLVPLLRDPKAKRDPAVITFMRGNHAVKTERWRYIRYEDGSEELYDSVADPNEFTNLASRSEHAPVKRELARWIPVKNAAPVPPRKAYDFDFARHTWRLRPAP
jgi:arylsulfatase A-like enzyme